MLSERQYGFREGRSTEDAIVHLTKSIYKSLNDSKPSMAVFIDLAKAFDTVDHVQLLKILELVGFRGAPYNLMKSYLDNRMQMVDISGAISEKHVIEFGVPQGTVLGPILFNIYLRDLYNLETSGNVVSFADDTAIFFSDVDWHTLRVQVQTELGKFIHYFNSKLLTVNFSKTFYVPFVSYPKYLPQYSQLEITEHCFDVVIKAKASVKYLGVYVDSHLRWDTQANYVVRKLRSLLHKFKLLSQIFNAYYLRILYHSLVEPHLSYGIVAWGGITNNYLYHVQKTQKWILKIIYKVDFTYPTDVLYKETRVFDLRQIFCYSILVRQYRNRHELERVDHNYGTRSKEHSTRVPKVDKTIAQRGYDFLGPRIYNMIPVELKGIQSEGLFKSRIKRWIHGKDRNEIAGMVDLKNVSYITY